MSDVDGRSLTNYIDILAEAKRFYSKLYTARAHNSMFHYFEKNSPDNSLSDEQSFLCEGRQRGYAFLELE